MAAGDDPVEQREVGQLIEIAARQREIDLRSSYHETTHVEHNAMHAAEHHAEAAVGRQEDRALQAAFNAHKAEHAANDLAITTALATVNRLADVHSQAHQREHAAHETRHDDAAIALDKASDAIERRLGSMNEMRGQLDKQALTFSSNERVDALMAGVHGRMEGLVKLVDDRYETNRQRIETLEKADVKTEGKTLGQGATIAIIVGAVGVIATLIGIFNALRP